MAKSGPTTGRSTWTPSWGRPWTGQDGVRRSSPPCWRGEAKALLLRLIDAENEIGSTLALEYFIQGFRLGMKLAVEGLDEAEGVDGA